MKTRPTLKQRIPVWPFLLFVVIVISIGFMWTKSVAVHIKERVNVIVYGQHTLFLSIGVKDGINYYTFLPSDAKINVPGGYGEYRVGAIGKLAHLEKNTDIYKKGFTSATGTFIDLFFFPSDAVIYYEEEKENPSLSDLTLAKMMSMRSNGSLIDKLYIYNFLKNQSDSLKRLKFTNSEDYLKKYQGYFYYTDFRKERKTVQVVYNKKYKVALAVSDILKNAGVNVSDLSSTGDYKNGSCVIRERSSPHSITASKTATFFRCSLEKGNTDIYDIIIYLKSAEDYWE